MALTSSCYTNNTTVWLAVVFLLAFTEGRLSDLSTVNSKLQKAGAVVFSSGDVFFDALLPFHATSSNNATCSEIYINGLVLLEAIKFAVKEVNRLKLLPGTIKLGYEIRDTCSSVVISQQHILEMVLKSTKYTEYAKYVNNLKRSKLLAVIGAGNSEISVAVNRVLSAFDIPQIGFASTSRYLSNKDRFPSFFRTVPPDSIQVEALISLFKQFSWNYAAILFSDNDYGRPLAKSFKDMAEKHGICIGFESVISHGDNQTKNLDTTINKLKLEINLEVIVIFVLERKMKQILQVMLENGFVNKTLIASDSWSRSTEGYGAQFKQILRGTLGFAHRYVPVKKFDEYFRELKPDINSPDPWFNETWEYLFNCKLQKSNSTLERSTKYCNIKEQNLNKNLFSKYHYVIHVINAVFAVAHGIRKYCQNLKRPEICHSSINSKKLMEHLNEIEFCGYDGTDIVFNKDGDVEGGYNLINVLPDMRSKIIGSWRSDNGGVLQLNASKIIWNSVQRTSPKGICTQLCLPGWFKVPWKKNPQCCWECQACSEGMISNQSNAIACSPCGEDYETNTNRTECVKIPVTYLNWDNALTVTGAVIALIAILLLMSVVTLFIRFANTPVVKSSNRELSFLLCLGLLVTFLVPFTFAGKPTPIKCMTSQCMFCVGSALALSAMLFKTLRIVLVFEYDRRKWFLENKYEIAFTIALTLTELIYCLLWVAVNPPKVKVISIRDKRYMVCYFEKYWYAGSHLLLIFLSFLCTGLAIRGRKLPKNFNEMKYITLSMFTFNIVWLVFAGAQHGTSMGYDTRINCFAIIISSLMILLLLFGPKVFLLLFRPQLNKPQEFHDEIKRYSFQKSNVNLYDTGATKSSRTSSFAYPITVDFLRPLNLPTNNLLTVPGSLDFKRKRAHTFDTATTIHQEYSCQKRKYQSLEAIYDHNSHQFSSTSSFPPKKENVNPSLVKQTSKKGKGTDNISKQNLNDVPIFGGKRCRLCNQTLKHNFPSSMPNIPPFIVNEPEIIIDADQNALQDCTNHSDASSTMLPHQNIMVEVTGQRTIDNEDSYTESSALVDCHRQCEKEKKDNSLWKNFDMTKNKSSFVNKSERETVL